MVTTLSKLIAGTLLITALSAFSVRAQVTLSQPLANGSGITLPQTDAGEYGLERGMNEFGVWGGGGYSVAAFTGLTDEEASGRGMAMIGLRYGRVLHASQKIAFEYTIDAIPLVAAFNNVVRRGAPSARVREHAYGVGVNPIGLKLIFRPQRRVKPFVAVDLGILYFTRQFPVPDSSRFNFNSELDSGLTIFNRSRRAVTLGFKFNHISNAGAGELNPGFNSVVFYAGYSLFR